MSRRNSEAGLRRPRLTLLATLLAVAALAVLGLGVEHRLSPISLEIGGSDSSRAERLAAESFGESSPFVVLLRGPAAAIERQGPALLHALRRHDPRLTVLSPWGPGSSVDLRPGPRRALLLLDYEVPLAEAMSDTVPALEATLQRHIHPPLRATESGYASVSRALQEESF